MRSEDRRQFIVADACHQIIAILPRFLFEESVADHAAYFVNATVSENIVDRLL
jgi:hypothetical protein